MKLNVTILAATLLILPSTLLAEWEQQSPIPSHVHITGMDFVDENEGWFVGNEIFQRGEIWHTTDGGLSWTQQFQNEFAQFNDIDMIDDQTGWAIGLDLYFTTDGGASWNEGLLPPQGVTGNYVQFVTPTTGWLSTRPSGFTNYLYRTTNSGLTWDYQGEFYVGRWQFVDNNVGWAIDDDQSVLRTTDGGSSWQNLPSPSPNSIDNEIYYAFSDQRIIVRCFDLTNLLSWWLTEDGGNTWTQVSGNAGKNATFRDDGLTGYALSGYDVVKTEDGGASWSVHGDDVGLKSIYTISIAGDRVLAAGDYGFLTAAGSDGEWGQLGSGTGEELFDIEFLTPEIGWAVGPGFGLVQTTDGGNNWKGVLLPGDRVLLGKVEVVSPNFVFVASGTHGSGSLGKFYLTTNGTDWTETGWPVGEAHFIDEQQGWILTYDGTEIHSTTDGGQTWITSPTSGINLQTLEELYDLCFVDANLAFACGRFNKVYRSTDGGLTWVRLTYPTPPSEFLFEVKFANPTHGWVTGNQGTVLRTTNGGDSWIPQHQDVGSGVQDLCIVGPDEALICGGYTGGLGWVRHTTDGGTTWPFAVSDLPTIQNGVAKKGGHVWTVGTHGTILHRAPETTSAENFPPSTGDWLRGLKATPNPAPQRASLEFELLEAGHTSVVVFDALGREVTTLLDERMEPGLHRFEWDGQDTLGHSLPSGRYFLRISHSSGTTTLPIVRTR